MRGEREGVANVTDKLLIARDLAQLMSNLSEETWCAGWFHGTEYSLWQMLQRPDPFAPAEWGMGEVQSDDLRKLRELSDACGGWVYWHETPDSEPDWYVKTGERFIAMDEWLPMYDAHMRKVDR